MVASRILLSLLLVPLLFGCGDSFTPEELAGTYGLTTIEGRDPPFLELASTECDQWIVDGGLEIRSDATYTLSLMIEVDCTRGGGLVDQQDRIYTGSFTLADDRLEFTWHPPSGGVETFGGRARGSVVDIALPPTAFTLDPFLDVRFDH